jgi:N utilization substance protein B
MADPRHLRRIKLIQNLFAYSFLTENNQPNEDESADAIIKRLPEIDALIHEHAPKYPIERIARMDLAILRLAIYELVIVQEEPPKVIIDEAVTLAKEFGGERSYAFINAVLGAIYKTLPQPPEEESKDTEKEKTEKTDHPEAEVTEEKEE